MSVVVYAENSNGKFKKAVFEAASMAASMAESLGSEVVAVSIGEVDESELQSLGNYGVKKVYKISGDGMNNFADGAYAEAIDKVAKQVGASAIFMAQTYNGKSIAPRVAIRRDAALLSGVTDLPSQENGGYTAVKTSNSGKGIETVHTACERIVATVKVNSYGLTERSGSIEIENMEFSSSRPGAVAKEVVKATSKISITEADTVISGGRGFKGPENWHLLEDLAEALQAGTACSKPVADMDWRPHHEHVGQTGIQIAPNLYIAIGISGAIQHLAGVNSSKHIVVINKDPEAPFFKIADYGIVGDLFEVLPKLLEAVKQVNTANV